ncbi:MAG: sugar phosphate nucleotidyltransferase [Nitrososphaeria archaeon]|jgi:bifunctional UDP-N-acetylglucosamine pyrophosphorylase/glucosamine-1-phosphate N-acetyltransferase
MKIIFLCGGVGKRMFPIKKDKCLLDFLGKPLLEHHIEQARKIGLNDFVIVGNSSNIKKIKSIFSRNKVKAVFFIQDGPFGMADALMKAKDAILNDEILVVNPNDIFSSSLYQNIIEEAESNGYDSSIAAHRVDSYFPGGYLVVNSKHELLSISEKPGPGNEPSNLINIVVHFHRDPEKLLNQIEKTKSSDDNIYESAFTSLIKKGYKVKVLEYDGPWIAIKYPWHIIEAAEYFLNSLKVSKISGSARISKKATLDGNVFISDEVQILEGAIIKGPCYIGPKTTIGNYSLVRDHVHIGSGCTIGFSTEITRSYIGNGCFFHSNYVGDSIIADNCLLGDRTLTANLRFDKKTIKVYVNNILQDTGRMKLGAMMGEGSCIGVGAMLMPGVKIGSSSIVGPGVVLYNDTVPNSRVYLKQEFNGEKVDKEK